MKVYIGIDWSKEKHDVGILSEKGEAITHFKIAHNLGGFEQIDKVCQQLGSRPEECWIGIETSHNLLIDYLWEHQYQHLYILPPSKTKAERPSEHISGAYNDTSDAFLIARLLWNKLEAFYAWQPEGTMIRQMRTIVSLVVHLNEQIIRTSNRLTSVLSRYYPAALQVFSEVDGFVSLAFIQTYPTPQQAAALSLEEFVAFARQRRYPRPSALAGRFARLQQPQPQALESVVTAYAREAVLLAELLERLKRSKIELQAELSQLFEQHPDRPIFASLPGAGEWLAPALLAKLGDNRQRFPEAAYLQGVAGTCPVTQESGRHRQVIFRHACDHELRHIVQQWARLSVLRCGWAAVYYQEVFQRCGSENQAYRSLANRWLKILWRIWQDHKEYDEAYHLKQIALRKQPKPNQKSWPLT